MCGITVLFYGPNVIAKAAAKWRNRALGGAYSAWAEATEFRIWARKLLRRVLGKLANAKLGAGFRSWLQFVDASRAEESTLARQRVLMGRILKRLLHAGLNKGWGAWRGEVEAHRAYVLALTRAHARWTKKRLGAAFNSWYDDGSHI